MKGDWHTRAVGSVLSQLGTSDKGLTNSEAGSRLAKYGPNELREMKKETPLQMFFSQFNNLLVILLISAAFLSLGLSILTPEGGEEEIYESAAILLVVFFITVVGFLQEYRAEKELQALKRMVSIEATVLRDGKHRRMPAKDLVPGDILLLEAGDRIPADARLLETIDFRVDESALTGESVTVRKEESFLSVDAPLADRRNMVYMGTHASYGKAKAVVVATGMETELGKIAEKIQSMEREKTPLQVKLDVVGKQIGIIVLVLCTIVFMAGMVRADSIDLSFLIYMFMAAIALAVAAVPEGLPAVVTVALAKGMREMVKKNALVKKLNAVETLGATTVICSDKTGTLTRNEMTVRKIYLPGRIIEVSGEGYKPSGIFTYKDKPVGREDADLKLLLSAAALCNNASLENVQDGIWEITGDPTEAALIVAASKAGLSEDELSSSYPRISEIPFSSERKRMTTVHRTPGGKRVAYMKGAPDILLESCKFVLKEGKVEKLDERQRNDVLARNNEMAEKALRILGVAYRTLDDAEKPDGGIEHDMIFIGLLGMIDPPRKDATEAAKVANKAGIRSVIITGDHKLTAVAVAREMGLFHDGDKVLTGAELDKLADEEFHSIVEEVVIYARVSPEHKLRIVDALKKNGHIVAMTGDGVNDAPALKKADIGIAMGITGTDVAKEASSMILVDDNFASIVSAIKEGRGIYENIKLFIKYLLSCNIGEVLTIFIGVTAFAKLPILPLQILWMNLLTDAAPALALAWNPPEKGIMDRKPRDPRESIINKRTAEGFLSVGALMALGTIALFYLNLADEAKAVTIAFTTIIMFQLFYVLSCKSEKSSFIASGILSNKYLLSAVAFSFIMHLLVLYLPALQNIFNTVPLSTREWGAILAVSSTAFILPEIWKLRKR